MPNLYVPRVLLRLDRIPPRPDTRYHNIGESILGFTVHFGEINPDRSYLVNEVGRASPKDVLPLSPLFGKSG